MKIRVQTIDGDVRYFPCKYPFVGLDYRLHLFICYAYIQRKYYPDLPLKALQFDFDFSDVDDEVI